MDRKRERGREREGEIEKEREREKGREKMIFFQKIPKTIYIELKTPVSPSV